MGTETYLAGSEMDRLVAEKVLHWSSIDESSPDGKRGYKWLKSDGNKGCYTPGFSTGIAECWQIVDELTKSGKKFALEINTVRESDRQTQVVKAVFTERFAGMADSVALAICRAALTMVED